MPTRAERLADHFIRCAGIAGVYVDARGGIGSIDAVSIFSEPAAIVFCCASGNHVKVAALARKHRDAIAGQRADALTAVRAAADELGVAMTPLETVASRASAAVAAVSETISDMQRTGGMKELNRDFKIARKADTRLRYHDFLHDRKAAMLAALAREK